MSAGGNFGRGGGDAVLVVGNAGNGGNAGNVTTGDLFSWTLKCFRRIGNPALML